jgi:uncharacterized protein (TIRG00374 family)
MWRRILYFLFTILIIWYFARNWQELAQIGHDIRHGVWYWVLAAALSQVIHYFFHMLAVKRSFAALNHHRKGRELALVTLAALAVNVVAPSMNVSGMAYLVDDAQRRGFPTAASLLAAGVTVLVDGTVFIVFAVVVAVALLITGGLSTAFLVGISVLMGLVAFFIALIAYFWKRPHGVRPWLRIFGKDRAELWSREWLEVTQLGISFKKIKPVIGCEILAHLFNFGSLIFAFAAFGIPALTLKPAIAYTVGVLFVILSPTPMGIGFAESGMTVAMVGQGVPLAAASAITLVYRGFAFWIPFIIGGIILHYLHLAPSNDSHAQQN